MKPDDIKNSFDKVTLSDSQKSRMLEEIKARLKSPGGNRKPSPRHWIAAGACFAVLAAAITVWALPSGSPPGLTGESSATEDNVLPGDIADDAGERNEMAAMPLLNQFTLHGRQYILLDEYTAKEFGLALVPNAGELGEKIAEITKAADPALTGGIVYRYKKIPGEAVVAVKIGKVYKLFRFFTFDKYNENADEDTAEYLKLFGIGSASDIARVDFISYTEQAKLENRLNVVGSISKAEDIKKFYNYYSVIKDSSAAYFDKLFNYRKEITGEGEEEVPAQSGQVEPVPPDAPGDYGTPQTTPNTAEDLPGYAEDTPAVDGRQPYDTGDSADSGAESPGYAGSGAADLLANQVTVRIYAKSGIYFDAVYYPDMGFISRHEVTAPFAQFLAGFIG